MAEVLEFLLGALDVLPDAGLAWVRWLGIGAAVLVLGVILVVARAGPGAAFATGVVGTLVLAGGAIVVHDAFDTDA
jgi:hypothetical protein